MITAKQNDKSAATKSPKVIPAITRIAVTGFKSLHERTEVEVRPLTLLAGVNSSGKSSLMQPLLLLKQTLDATFDPGPLKLDGPNARFTSSDQLFSKVASSTKEFSVALDIESTNMRVVFQKHGKQQLQLAQFEWKEAKDTFVLRPGMQFEQLPAELLKLPLGDVLGGLLDWASKLSKKEVSGYHVIADRFLPRLAAEVDGDKLSDIFRPFIFQLPAAVEAIIHVPGFRGNPSRSHPRTGIGPKFPGTFEVYAAALLYQWQNESHESISKVSNDLQTLGLTWKVEVTEIDQTQFELRVGRLLKSRQGGARDVVSIADVGFGVSQVLPVVVALRAAQPGELVYIEQPELHLHPRAQAAMAQLLADAATRGARVVAETHSQELLLGVQTLVAEGKLDPALVKLHWFERDADGWSKVTSADLDETGAFGEWPVDFADVSLETQSRYLDAAESKGAQRAAS